MLTLHVTNGDAAAGGLARSGLPGDVLSWRDILHDGPVPPDGYPDGDGPAFRMARARFLAERALANVDDVVVDFEERDARLAGVGAGNEVVLWFEPDLFDQLQLIQILARLAARAPEDKPRLTIVPADLYLGPLAPEKFVPLYEVRRAVRDEDLAQGTAAWEAFTHGGPAAIMAVVERLDREVTARTYASSEETRLPFLAAALRRQLEELPDLHHGLSRSERQICEALAPGEITLSKLYRTSHHAAESWIWLGDWSFSWYCQRLSECTEPVLVHGNGTRLIAPHGDRDAKQFWERTVRLTPFGQELVRERADHVAANGIERWIGGKQLTTAHHWRWDGHAQRPVERRG